MKELRPIAPPPVLAILPWVIAVAAAWLAVGNQAWAQSLLLAAVGCLYFFFPPSGAFPKPLLVLFGLLLLLSLTAFLPVALVGSAMHKPFLDHGIILPPTLSPQPWLSLEDLTLLFASLLWAWSCFESKLSLDQRKFLVTSYLVALGVVAAVTIIRGTEAESKLPTFMRDLGQFVNRNQTGDLLVMGGIVAFTRGVSDLSKRKTFGAVWILLTGLFMLAVVRNDSRAAVGLFAIGLLLAFGLMPRGRHRHWHVQLTMFIVFLGGMLIFLFEGEEIQKRFSLMFTEGQAGRLPIYRDALAMMMRDPWCGVGLGDFEGVFNIHRFYSDQHVARCLHPESDWLWIGVELGVFGVIIVALIVALTFRIYLLKTPFPGLSNTCIAVALVFLLHSLFDVGGHRLGTVWSCLYLVSLGAFRPALPTDGRVPQIVLRLAGLLLLVATCFRIQSMSLYPWIPTQASLDKVEDSLDPGISPLKQKELLDRGIGWAPLDYSFYYHRALICMQFPDLSDESNDDFNRALFLEQNTVELPSAVGDACRRTNFSEALVAWQSLFQRARTRRVEFFENIYGGTPDTKNRLELTTLAEGDPDLQTISVILEDPPEFDWLLQDLLDSNPSLKGVDPVLTRRLFDRWVQVGKSEQFLESWPLHPEWAAPGWRAYAKGLAKDGRFKEAVATAFQFMPPPQLPDFHDVDIDEAQHQYLDDPEDPLTGIRLYFAQTAAGFNDQAMNTLIEVAKLPKAPLYIRYLLAKHQLAEGQDEAAWDALEPLLNGH